jgi:thiol:disulfide interchange protein DsbD
MIFLALLAAPIVWLHDEARATTLARDSGRQLLIEIRAPWCGACKLLDRRTWSDRAVQREVAAHFVALEIDFEQAERFQVAEVPTIVVGTRRITGFVPPDEMLRFLKRP